MAKRLSKLLFVALCMVLCLCACTVASTVHTEKSEYAVGEVVEFIDNQSEYVLGEVVITDVIVIYDDVYYEKELVKTDYDGDKIYENVRYEGVVQINYRAKYIDSSNKVDERNFTVTDCEGNRTDCSPTVSYDEEKTSDDCFVVGVKKLGEYVDIHISYKKNQYSVASVKGYYDNAKHFGGTNDSSLIADSTNNSSQQNNSGAVIAILSAVCVIEFFVIIVLISVFVISPKIEEKRMRKLYPKYYQYTQYPQEQMPVTEQEDTEEYYE